MNQIESSTTQLPDLFFKRSLPMKLNRPQLIRFNQELSVELGLDFQNSSPEELALIFSGQELLPGSEPVSLVYAGHQFGHFSPQLGDGRAHLLGEIRTSKNQVYDLQLKGSGPTPFSRGGDGKSPLGPVIREYLVSEAMASLGVPTTRSLAAVLTGEDVFRETSSPGAILTRVASSHLRIGTFEFFASRQDTVSLKTLLDRAIERHDKDLINEQDKALGFFTRVCDRQAQLVAQWMSLGFVHGVMNTDNVTLSGETIDYGPCAFLDEYDPKKVFSFIDRGGRYAFNQQAQIALWNLTRLAECLIPLIPGEPNSVVQELQDQLDLFLGTHNKYLLELQAKKLGILQPTPEDREILELWYKYLETEKMDFTQSFRKIPEVLAPQTNGIAFFQKTPEFDQFFNLWRNRLPDLRLQEFKKRIETLSPALIPRNHLIEQIIDSANDGDFSQFHSFHEALKTPFKTSNENSPFNQPPEKSERVSQTFCGT